MKPILTRLGVLTILLVVGIAVAWPRLIRKKSAHLKEIADEIGSIAELRHPYIVVNNAGTRLLVNMDAPKGAGLYLFDIASRSNKLLHYDDQAGYDWRQYKMLGWCPDDSLLAYGHQGRQKTNASDSVPGDLVIADGQTGESRSVIRVAEDSTNTLSQFAWLAPRSFAYLDGNQDLHIYEQSAGGWKQTRIFTNATGGALHEAQNFLALSPSSLAWRLRGTLWKFDLTTGAATPLWKSSTNQGTTNTLITYSYTQENGTFMLVCNDRPLSRGDHLALYSFNPVDCSLKSILAFPQGVTRDVPPVWINNQSGCVILSPEGAYGTMWKSTNLESAPESIFRRGEIRTAVVRGDHLFLAGTLTNEPPSAWNYDLKSGAVDCILSGATHGLKHTECVPFEVVALTNVAGQRFSYHIWKPAHFDPSKKYPLVIGNSPYSWTPFPLAAANTGHYFVTVDRPNWTSPMDDWVEKLMTGYRDVTRNPNIDTNRVMLCVRSIESAGIYDLLAKDAAIWKSAMLLDPASVPPFSRDYFSKVFITAGEFDEPVLENVLKSKKSLEQEGISVNLTILRGAGHVSYGVGVQQQRMAAMVKFLGEE